MDNNHDHDEKFNCPACGQDSLDKKTFFCPTCNLLVNEEENSNDLIIVDPKKEEALTQEIEFRKIQLVEAIIASIGSEYEQDFRNRAIAIKLNPEYLPKHINGRKENVDGIKNIFKEFLKPENASFILIDDSPEKITFCKLTKHKNIIQAESQEIDWEKGFSKKTNDRALQLVSGFRNLSDNWLFNLGNNFVTAYDQKFLCSRFTEAKHSEKLKDTFDINDDNSIHYQSAKTFLELVDYFCKIAPLTETIKVYSACLDIGTSEMSKVSYQAVPIFSTGRFIDELCPVTLTLKSNRKIAGPSKLYFFNSDPFGSGDIYEAEVYLMPNQIQKVEIRLDDRRYLANLKVNKNLVSKVEKTLDLPENIMHNTPKLEVFFILDTLLNITKTNNKIVESIEGFILRKSFITKLIDKIIQLLPLYDVNFITYAYSCDYLPSSQKRPEHWPKNTVINFNGNAKKTQSELEKIKPTGSFKRNRYGVFEAVEYKPKLFNGRLEDVFEQIKNYLQISGSQTRFLFLVGNRPANPSEDTSSMFGVGKDAIELFEEISSQFCLKKFFQDDQPLYYDPDFVDYHETFWDGLIHHENDSKKLSIGTEESLIDELEQEMRQNTVLIKDLQVPEISLFKEDKKDGL